MKLLERLALLRKTFVFLVVVLLFALMVRLEVMRGCPYVLWFERVSWPVYRAVTYPVESRVVELVL